MLRLFIVLCLLAWLAGCGRKEDATKDSDLALIQPANATAWPVQRFGPDEFGVVCYSRSTESLDCLKVQP